MKKSFETLKTEVRKGETYYITLHLHSYCRLFFQSRVYNTDFAEIRPHSCELATHVICGSVVTQLRSETLKLRLSENEASQTRNLKKKPGGRAFCSWPMLCCLLTYSPITSRIYWKVGLTDCSANDESAQDTQTEDARISGHKAVPSRAARRTASMAG